MVGISPCVYCRNMSSHCPHSFEAVLLGSRGFSSKSRDGSVFPGRWSFHESRHYDFVMVELLPLVCESLRRCVSSTGCLEKIPFLECLHICDSPKGILAWLREPIG